MAGKTKFQAKDGWITNWNTLYRTATGLEHGHGTPGGRGWSRKAKKPKSGPEMHVNQDAFGFGRLQPIWNFCPSKSCSNFLKNFNYQKWPDKFCFLSFARHRVLSFGLARMETIQSAPPFEGYAQTEVPVGRSLRWPIRNQVV
jgi:hypothetical protein